MFEHVGRDLDPQWRRRYTLAAAITAGGLGGAVGAVVTLSMAVLTAMNWLGLQPPPPESFVLTPEAIEMIQVVLNEEEEVLEPPEPPPELPPAPPPTPDEAASDDEPAADAAGEPEQGPISKGENPHETEMDEDVKELEEPDDDALSELDDPLSGDDEEPTEEALLATQTRLEALEAVRAEGLLTLGDLGFDRKELDPGYTDESRRFDGIFGPRDSHILLAALRDGQVDALRSANAPDGGYTMAMGSFGFAGFMGPTQSMHLPPPRELVEAAAPPYPRKLRKLFGDSVDCTMHVTVDGDGHPIGFKVVDRPLPCPDELHEAALEAAHNSIWAAAPNGAEATVKHIVEFRK